MKNYIVTSFIGIAACLLLVAAAEGLVQVPAAEPAPAAAVKPVKGKPAVPTSGKSTRQPAAAKESSPSKSQESAALVQQRLRRCQLHPGTCMQGSGRPPPDGHRD